MRRMIVPIALITLIAPGLARAEHAKVELTVRSGRAQETAYVDQTPPDSGKNPRPVLKVKAGETIKVQYMLTNVYPHKTLENVVVHFYVARQGKVAQKETPDLSDEKNVVLETAFEMDFKPGGKAGTRASFKVDTKGVYLIRCETKQTQSDHEHFGAIDLVVE